MGKKKPGPTKTKDTEETPDKEDPKKKKKKLQPWEVGKTAKYDAATISNTVPAVAGIIDPVERVKASQISPTAMYSGATVAPVANANRVAVDRAGDSAFRTKQLGLANQLEESAAGRGPSLASLQLQDATNRLNAGTLGTIAASRGMSPALGARLALKQRAAAGQSLAMQSAQARMAEAMQARQQLAEVTTAGRAAELGLSGQDAQLAQATELANSQAANRVAEVQAGLNQQAGLTAAAAENARALEQARLLQESATGNALASNTRAQNQALYTTEANKSTAEMANQRATQQAQLQQSASATNTAAINAALTKEAELRTGIKNQATQSQAQVDASKASAWGNVASAGTTAHGSLLETQLEQAGLNYRNDLAIASGINDAEADRGSQYDANTVTANQSAQNSQNNIVFSDKRLKKNIKPANRDIKQFLDKLTAAQYDYKQKKHGAVKQTGVMAQDLEKSDIGRQLVKSTKTGKKVDFQKGLGAILAAQAALNKRINELEKRRK